MKLGNLELESNLFLSPLAGYTNLPFRLTVKSLGGLGLVTTDLVNARSLLEKRPVAYKMIVTDPREQPMSVQLFGGVPEEMRDAALIVQERGAQSVDINMGCPVKKVTKTGSGVLYDEGLTGDAATGERDGGRARHSSDGQNASWLG